MRVTGLDLSLAKTGVALGQDGTVRTITRLMSAADDGTIEGRSRRLRGMVSKVWPYVAVSDLVVVEQPSYGSTGGKAHDRSGFWWMLVGRMTGAGIPVVEVAPATVKVYATGGGRGSKTEVMAAMIRRHPQLEIHDDNEADALTLLLMGMRHVGCPYDEPLPQTHTRAMSAPDWPQRKVQNHD